MTRRSVGDRVLLAAPLFSTAVTGLLGGPGEDAQLTVAPLGEASRSALRSCADVLLGVTDGVLGRLGAAADSALSRHPGSLVATVASRDGRAVARTRGGGGLDAVPVTGGTPGAETTARVLGAFLHAGLVAGLRPALVSGLWAQPLVEANTLGKGDVTVSEAPHGNCYVWSLSRSTRSTSAGLRGS